MSVQAAETAPRYGQSPAWDSIAITVMPIRRTMWNIIRGRRSTASDRSEATKSGQVGVLFCGVYLGGFKEVLDGREGRSRGGYVEYGAAGPNVSEGLAVGTAQFQHGPLSVGAAKLNASKWGAVGVAWADDVAHLEFVGIFLVEILIHGLAPFARQCVTAFSRFQSLFREFSVFPMSIPLLEAGAQTPGSPSPPDPAGTDCYQ